MKPEFTRREILQHAGGCGLAAAGGGLLASRALCAEDQSQAPAKGKAKSCIFLWLSGGVSQIDTWDSKRRGNVAKRAAGSAYRAINTSIKNVQICEHLKATATLLDCGVLIRTVNHKISKSHPPATNFMHTGRLPTGSTVYPSIGSVVSHELGPQIDDVPAYMVLGLPNDSRGPGFLGAKHSYLYLTDTKTGIEGLSRPTAITDARQTRRERLLTEASDEYFMRNAADAKLRDYLDVSNAARRLMQSDFRKALDVAREPQRVQTAFGSEFGQRCLLARRLVQAGARFVEVSYNLNFKNGTGWDTHAQGQRNQHLLIQDLDKSLAALINDLEANGRLDETLIVVASEFGRPGGFDKNGGRDHHSAAFSVAMFGGGLRTGQVVGVTNDLAEKIVERPVSVPDLHATIYAALGIDPRKSLYDGDRPVPITNHGRPIAELFG